MAIRVGINGLGRIGRNALRAAEQHPEIEIVAINDLADAATLTHLLKYDSILGVYPGSIDLDGDAIVVDGKRLKVLGEKEPAKLPWAALGVDLVLECTGAFTDATKARAHIDKGGAKKVILSAPGKNEDVTIVLGVNQDQYVADRHHVISNASCTTNCLAPVVKVLNDRFGVESGIMTTVHAYTSSQRILDAPHRDLRRARAAALSIIPTTTGAVRAMTKVMPELEGKFLGMAIRVPVPNVSLVDVTVVTKEPVNVDLINTAFRKAAGGTLKDIVAVSNAPLVSVDFMTDPHSAIVDAASTMVVGDHLAKVLAWYDNEWGYACRLLDLASFVGAKLGGQVTPQPAVAGRDGG
jgi:glyceraldehyde 3-phosphate dehydrogenase